MGQTLLNVERDGGVLIVTLDDPSSRNALGADMGKELYQELEEFESNPSDRVLLLTGKDPAFCSGANIRGFNQTIQDTQSAKPDTFLPWGNMEHRLGSRAVHTAEAGFSVSDMPLRIHQIQKPTIAAVNGHAIGVGLGLALACDIRIASDRGEFAEAFSRMGLVPGDGSCWQLPRMIGFSNTYFMQYTGDRINAADALNMNLVSKVYPHEEMMTGALELAARLAKGATYAMSLTKYLVQESAGQGFEENLRLAQSAQELARRSEDHKEAVEAFLDKRRPEFNGR